MTLESLKNCVNNEKGSKIKGKIIKISMTFNENKPNLKNIKIGVSSFKTSIYEILTAWRGEKTNPSKPNQSQFKPNPRKAKNEHKFYNKNELQEFSPLAGQKNKPNSNPSKPNQACPRISWSGAQFQTRPILIDSTKRIYYYGIE